LQKLSLDLELLHNWVSLSPREKELFGADFGTSSKLRSLNLSFSNRSLPALTTILLKLNTKRSILSELGLHGVAEWNLPKPAMDALISLLLPTRALRTLEMHNARISKTDADRMVAALYQTRLVKLSLFGCGYTAGKKSAPVCSTNKHNQRIVAGNVPVCTLRDLVVQDGYMAGLLPLDVVSMVFGASDNLGNGVPTIGSQLRSLSYEHARRNYRDCGLFESLKSNASKIRLEKLTLFRLTTVECSDLSVCLPLLQSLKELYIDGHCNAECVRLILVGVSNNHSLVKVSFGSAIEDSSSERLESYLERNRKAVSTPDDVENVD
jgi:hypothetical protein